MMDTRKLSRGYSKGARQRAKRSAEATHKQEKAMALHIKEKAMAFRTEVMNATVSTLRAMAKAAGHVGYSKLRRDPLREMLLS